jgi:hypothetical protein
VSSSRCYWCGQALSLIHTTITYPDLIEVMDGPCCPCPQRGVDLGRNSLRYSILSFHTRGRTSRAKFADLAKAAGLSVQLHFIDVPAEERWRRVETRNAQKGETSKLGFDVTREMFDFVEGLWEPPTHAEMLAYNGLRTLGI